MLHFPWIPIVVYLQKMVYIYILKLEKKKYYVGKTTNPSFRLEKHFNSSGSYWTKKYKPISVLEIIPNCDDYDEDKYTIKYMETFGIMNVRGGSFCELKLSEENKNTLKQMINGSTDKCYKCGREGHYVVDCYAKTTISGEPIDEEEDVYRCSYCDKEFDTLKGATCHENLYCKKKQNKKAPTTDNKVVCYKCGRDGHYSNECYASRDIDGRYVK
jgi:hypothetical protein